MLYGTEVTPELYGSKGFNNPRCHDNDEDVFWADVNVSLVAACVLNFFFSALFWKVSKPLMYVGGAAWTALVLREFCAQRMLAQERWFRKIASCSSTTKEVSEASGGEIVCAEKVVVDSGSEIPDAAVQALFH